MLNVLLVAPPLRVERGFSLCETLLWMTRMYDVWLHKCKLALQAAVCFKRSMLCFIRFEKHSISDFRLCSNTASTAYLNCTCAMKKKQANDNVIKREGQAFQRDKNCLTTCLDIPRSLHGNRKKANLNFCLWDVIFWFCLYKYIYIHTHTYNLFRQKGEESKHCIILLF